LVDLGRVDPEFGEEVAVFGDDSDVAVGDQEQDPGAVPVAADGEVAELGAVAEGDLAGFVDAVTAYSVLGGDGDARAAGAGFGAAANAAAGVRRPSARWGRTVL
jgi:hypothetical protein